MLWTINWHDILVPKRSVLVMVVRGTLMYAIVILFLKLVLKRQTGGLSTADVLVVVLVADAAGNGFSADYPSVVEAPSSVHLPSGTSSR